MANLLPIDKLNTLESYLEKIVTFPGVNYDEDEIVDSVLDLLIISYANGYDATNEMLDIVQKPDADKMRETIYKDIAGKNWEQRVRGYLEQGDLDGVLKVADTEFHRIYNQAVLTSAQESGRSVSKMWSTMMDDKVRETHDYLESVIVPLNEKFYTFDGDSAMFPGDFELPENNCGCRCVIELIPN